MDSKKSIIEIMENTISMLSANKASMISILNILKNDHTKKLENLREIQNSLPNMFAYTNKLSIEDQKIRLELMNSSSDFSPEGAIKLHKTYEKASKIHSLFLNAQQEEQNLIHKRNDLELEIKRNAFILEQAEVMSQQILASISFLQNSLSKFSKENDSTEQFLSQNTYISFFNLIEREKLKIARDLHDGPTQQIISAKMQADLCKSFLFKSPEHSKDCLDTITDTLSETLIDMRGILFNLQPAPLEKMKFKDSISYLLETILDTKSIDVTFIYQVTSNIDAIPYKSSLYRIIQELLSNIKKHAFANQVIIKISDDDSYIYVNIVDNGIGFSVPADLNDFYLLSKSYGLSNIHTRISELNGTIKINSSPNSGAIFKFQIPKVNSLGGLNV